MHLRRNMEHGENVDGANKNNFGNVSIGSSHWAVGQGEGKTNLQTSIHVAFPVMGGIHCDAGFLLNESGTGTM